MSFVPGLGRFPGEGNGKPFPSLAWEILWTESLAGYSPWDHKRVGHNLVTEQQQQQGLFEVPFRKRKGAFSLGMPHHMCLLQLILATAHTHTPACVQTKGRDRQRQRVFIVLKGS